MTAEQLNAVLVLFPEAHSVAMDGTGKTYVHFSKPMIHEWSISWHGNYGKIHIPSLDDFADNWRDSLVVLREDT